MRKKKVVHHFWKVIGTKIKGRKMELIHVIKVESLTARKNKDKFVGGILTTLIGEIEMIGKNDGNRTTTDAESIKCITKFKKGATETIEMLLNSNNNARVSDIQKEIEIYDAYLPKQMSAEELETAISGYINDGITNIGQIMEALKKEHGGTYDGKMASQIIKTLS